MSLIEPEVSFKIDSFAPGFLDTPDPETLVPGATPYARNCWFKRTQVERAQYAGMVGPRRANLARRPGCQLLTPTGIAIGTTVAFDGLFDYRRIGSLPGILVGVGGGKVWTYDNAATFTAIGATTPFVSGVQANFLTFRNLLFIMDGVHTRVWAGSGDLFAPGTVTPSTAPTLADGGAGTLIAATYEGYAVWYDSTLDHEGSPSAISPQLVLAANRQRTWGKPGGIAPAANYDNWRIYCRRVDTNELYFKRVGTVPIATLTFTEAVGDEARNLSTLGPLPGQNDAPPAFAIMGQFQGYALGVQVNDDQIWVSKSGDAQSQNPKDVIPVYRGIGGEIRSLVNFGTEIVVQKARRSYRLNGDRMPFIPQELHSEFGNAGQRSALEVDGLLYAWDLDKGPYVTDMASTWRRLADARIQNFLLTVNAGAASSIECAHYKAEHLILWSVPTDQTGRKRTLLAYDTLLDAFLPPITGIEYSALATFLTPGGDTNFYVGDYRGRLFRYFTGAREGVPSGDLQRLVTGTDLTGKTTGIVCLNAHFYITGDKLVGLPMVLVNAATGHQQWRRVDANTIDTLFPDAEWETDPLTLPAGSYVVVGGIDWVWRSSIAIFGDPDRQKRGGFFTVTTRSGASALAVQLVTFVNTIDRADAAKSLALPAPSDVWGTGLWGTMLWGAGGTTALKTRINRSFFALGFELSNYLPDQDCEVVRVSIGADYLPARLVASGGAVTIGFGSQS